MWSKMGPAVRSCVAIAVCVELLGFPSQGGSSEQAQVERLQDAAFDLWVEREARLQQIWDRVRLHALDLCRGESTAVLGLPSLRMEDFPDTLEAPAARRLGQRKAGQYCAFCRACRRRAAASERAT